MGEKDDEIGEGMEEVVLKMELHCGGCAKKVRRSIAQLEGVEEVRAEWEAKRVTVRGKNVDPTWLREKVEAKTKKKVELLLLPPPPPLIKEKQKKKKKKKKKKEDHHVVVMKTKLHCDGCAHKIRRIISNNLEGVESVTTDIERDVIRVVGTMNVEALLAYLRLKLKSGVHIIIPNTKLHDDDPIANKDNKDHQTSNIRELDQDHEIKKRDHDKKAVLELEPAEIKQKVVLPLIISIDGDEINIHEETTKMEVSKMEHGNYINVQTHHDYAMPMHTQTHHHHQNMDDHIAVLLQHTQAGPPLPPPTFLNTNDHSDENPNGCSLM